MSGQREGVVRLTPLRSSTETSSVNPSTEAAVCTTTSGTPPMNAEATLPMSVMVPPPMLTTAFDSGHRRDRPLDDRFRGVQFRMTVVQHDAADVVLGGQRFLDRRLDLRAVAPDRGAGPSPAPRSLVVPVPTPGRCRIKSSATAAVTADHAWDPIRTDFSRHGGSVPSGSASARICRLTCTGSASTSVPELSSDGALGLSGRASR